MLPYRNSQVQHVQDKHTAEESCTFRDKRHMTNQQIYILHKPQNLSLQY